MSTRNPYKLGQTYKTASEAFKDADYATGLWKCESDWDRTKNAIGWIVMWVVTLSVLYLFMSFFNSFV